MEVLNPTSRTDQRYAVEQARRCKPGLVESYKEMIGAVGLPAVVTFLTTSEAYQAGTPAENFLMLATLLGTMNEMTGDN